MYAYERVYATQVQYKPTHTCAKCSVLSLCARVVYGGSTGVYQP